VDDGEFAQLLKRLLSSSDNAFIYYPSAIIDLLDLAPKKFLMIFCLDKANSATDPNYGSGIKSKLCMCLNFS